MKIKRSTIIAVTLVAVALAAIVVKLNGNKKKFQSEIEFVKRNVENIPVTIDTVQTGNISKVVMESGRLEPAQSLTLVSETQGKIIHQYKRKGDVVKAGDVIIKVDDEVIAANVITAEANYEQFEKDIERFTRLAKEDAISNHDLEKTEIGYKKAKADLINARKALSNTSITAPISGYINDDFVTVGQFLGGGSRVCEIVDNSHLKININVSEDEVFLIHKGDVVTVLISAFPNQKFQGTITSIAEKADTALKFNVEITLDNDTKIHLKSGLYAEVKINVKVDNKIIIDKAAIIGSMEQPEVYVVSNNTAQKRSITLGQSNDKQVEVIKGLSTGELLIVSGQLNLNNGDGVKIVQ